MKYKNNYHRESNKRHEADIRDEKTADIVAYVLIIILLIGFLSSL